ncbi:hypothetical protein K505DRAFT_342022 [Melanomma pulvis-pyrius CBS 109.77]|uniref:Uncharacterized protein n=1 Tax=Melanomma pulvis-pyrius CBS 109.77 TaxID=1314802 RepID=A0A6A6WWP1_9PLEO|nr:hypothetical protein K505DRAFT_342022 [Melanomma pulvis-pyrius CBS 109.77]
MSSHQPSTRSRAPPPRAPRRPLLRERCALQTAGRAARGARRQWACWPWLDGRGHSARFYRRWPGRGPRARFAILNHYQVTFLVVPTILFALAIVAIGRRWHGRRMKKSKLAPDDYLWAFSLLLGYSMIALIFFLVYETGQGMPTTFVMQHRPEVLSLWIKLTPPLLCRPTVRKSNRIAQLCPAAKRDLRTARCHLSSVPTAHGRATVAYQT